MPVEQVPFDLVALLPKQREPLDAIVMPRPEVDDYSPEREALAMLSSLASDFDY